MKVRTPNIGGGHIENVNDPLARHSALLDAVECVCAENLFNIVKSREGPTRGRSVGSFDDDEPVIKEKEGTE